MLALAILAIFAHALTGSPHGGFVGIDVFFVLAGFLVTDALVHAGGHSKTVSSARFYWSRILRVLPAVAVVLLATYIAALLLFPAARAEKVGIDASFALAMVSNWQLALQGADPFSAIDATSPLQHLWAVSVGAQFQLLLPVVVVAIGLVVARTARPQFRRIALTAGTLAVITAASFAWSLSLSGSSPSWAYFGTFGRVWELGVGALLATAVGYLVHTPVMVKRLLSWTGFVLIVAGMLLISETTAGYPAPWTLLPVTGTAMIIASGIGGEPNYRPLLRNRASVYLGNIGFPLYLVHWPVIVLLAVLMNSGIYYYVSVVTLTFGLAMLIHHVIEKPLRYASREKIRDGMRAMEHGLLRLERSTKVGIVVGLILVTASLVAYAIRPDANTPVAAAPATACCVTTL